MPTQEEMERFYRHNEAARKADLEADKRLTMSERLEQTAELSRMVTELREGFLRRNGPPSR